MRKRSCFAGCLLSFMLFVCLGTPTHSEGAPPSIQADLSQCSNDDAAGSKNDGIIDPCKWTKGAINNVNSKYAESDAVPQRFLFTHADSVSAGTHTASFRLDFTIGKIHAFDFLVDPDHTMPTSFLNHCTDLPSFATEPECDATIGTSPGFSNMQLVAIPTDPFDSVPLHEHPAARFIHYGCADISDPNNPVPLNATPGFPATDCRILGVAIHHETTTGVLIPDSPGCTQNCPDSVVVYDITFTHPAGTVLIGMWFAGELSPSFDPDGLGPAIGWGFNSIVGKLDTASNVPGGSMDFRLVGVSGTTIGAQTDSVQSIAAGLNADLAIEKSCPTSVTKGNNVSYTIHAINNGTQTAPDVFFIDTLPAGVTFVSATPGLNTNGSPTSCTPYPISGPPFTQVQCDMGLMQPGDEIATVIVVNVPLSFVGTSISNSATIFGDVTDPNTTNNTTPACVTAVNTPLVSTDLGVSKTGPATVIAGNSITYTVTVHNFGPNPATNVIVTDQVPSVLVSPLTTITPSQGSCLESPPHVVTCNLGPLASGATATVTIGSTVDPAARGTITNVVTVSSDQSDPCIGAPADSCSCTTDTTNHCNTATFDTTVTGLVDLTVTKTCPASPVDAGSQITYHVRVDNAGPSTSLDTHIEDVLPSGVTFISATTSQGTGCTFDLVDSVHCVLGDIASGDFATADIVVLIDSGTSGDIVNVANIHVHNNEEPQGTCSVSGATCFLDSDCPVAGQTCSTNFTSTCTVTVQAPETTIDLSVTKTDLPDPVIAGNNLTYTITVTNQDATLTAHNVNVTDTLPAGIVLPPVAPTPTPSQGSCGVSSNVVTCSLGDLAAGASATVTIVVQVDPSTRGTITNTVTAVGDEADPCTTACTEGQSCACANPNTFIATTTVNGSDSLSIQKTDFPDPVFDGTDLTYTILVSNGGPSDSTGVTVVDTLPAGVLFVSASTTQGSCPTFSNTSVTCDLGTISPGGSVTITIVVKLNLGLAQGQSTVITNFAHVTSVEDPTDAQARTDTTVDPIPVAIPTLSEWGIIIFMLFAGLTAVYYLRRQKRV